MDKDLRASLLWPLQQSEKISADVIQKAAERLDEISTNVEVFNELKLRLQKLQSIVESSEEKYTDTERKLIRACINIFLAKNARKAGMISEEEYVFQSTYLIEHIHEDRWMNGAYDAELAPISAALDEIRGEYDVDPDEDLTSSEGLLEFQELNNQYGEILSQALTSTLREFSLNGLADMREQDLDKYELLRERGRRALLHRDEKLEVLGDIINGHEENARRAVESQAYSAAIIVLGAAMEGLLLFRCLQAPEKAKQVAKTFPRKPGNDPLRWSFNTLIAVCLKSGWLSPIATSMAAYDSDKLAHFLREQRNLVHPGKQIRSSPWIEINENEYKSVEAIYFLLKANIMDDSRLLTPLLPE